MTAKWNKRMYCTISKNQHAIIAAIPEPQVTEYEWLLQNRQATNPEYRNRYRRSCEMQGVNASFYSAYFSALTSAKTKLSSVGELCRTFYPFSIRNNEKKAITTQTLQFSFITKLRHTINSQLPVYDSRVAQFYLFREPSTKLPLPVRIQGLILFQHFLSQEYRREKNGILVSSIAAFREQFSPQQHTDTKIIDLFIWAFVELADKGKITW